MEDGEYDQQHDGDDQERVTHQVLLQSHVPGLDFEAEHRNLADKQVAAHQHQEDVGQLRNSLMDSLHLVQIYQANPEQGVGRRRQTDERERLTFVAVEFSQSQGREGCHDECAEWQYGSDGVNVSAALNVRVQDVPAQHRWRYAEGDTIGQRVEFLTDRTADVQRAGRHAVEEVEHRAANDEPAGQANHAIGRLQTTINSEATAQEVATGNQVGYIDKRLTFHNEVDYSKIGEFLNPLLYMYGNSPGVSIIKRPPQSEGEGLMRLSRLNLGYGSDVASHLVAHLDQHLGIQREEEVDARTELDESQFAVDL